jgi:hypothetical protein
VRQVLISWLLGVLFRIHCFYEVASVTCLAVTRLLTTEWELSWGLMTKDHDLKGVGMGSHDWLQCHQDNSLPHLTLLQRHWFCLFSLTPNWGEWLKS